MGKAFRRFISTLLCGFCTALACQTATAQTASRAAHTAPAWLREAVIYEVYPRAFSKEGNFKGVTSKLDELKDLGVSVLWLMPIHPIGAEQRKGTYGSPYAARDYYAVNP